MRANKSDSEFLLSFSDLILICRKGKYKIFFAMALCSLLACLYTLTKPIEYRVEATFKEKGKSQAGLGKSLNDLIFASVSENDSEAMALMKSRKLMEQLVKKMDMQGVIVRKSTPFSLLKKVKDNLIVQYAYFKKWKAPALPDQKPIVEVREISFYGEVPLTLEIVFLTEDDFTVTDQNQTSFGNGSLDQQFETDLYHFALKRKSEQPLKSQKFLLTLLPLASTAENLSKQFSIETDRFDKGLIKLAYKHPNRHQAAAHLNEFMTLYQNHLQNEHQRVANIQLAYLEKRQKKMRTQLKDLMVAHAHTLSDEVTSTGFANIEKAIDFLASNQASYKQKLMNIELEIQRLQKAQTQGEVSYDKFSFKEETSPMSHFSSEIRSLKQQADALDLALRNATATDPEALQQAFMAQLAQLEHVKECSQEAQLILASLEKGNLQPVYTKLLDDPKFMVKTWYEKLAHSSKKEDIKYCKASFIAYLTNLIHLFDVHQSSIEERLAHQQTPQEEYQGINLNIARELYLEYSREINEVQTKIIQDQFILRQIDDPAFELTSLSTVLNDPVSTQMISKSSALILAIKDKDNRSHNEVERLRSELAIQKGFLTTHLVQTIQLLDLHIKHLKGKVQQTQSTLLTLIQEQITILQKHMAEYIADRLDSLKLEKSLIESSIDGIRQDMAHLPEKWVNERLLNQQMDINQKMTEELIKLVESKNINSNLEVIQSAPIDVATVPIQPKSPRLPLYAALGAIMGALLSFGWLLIESVSKGIQATTDNLGLAGQYVAGSLVKISSNSSEPLLDADLNTLRRLSLFLDQPEEGSSKGQVVLLIKGTNADYSQQLANLLSKKGLKVLVLPLSFDAQSDSEDLPGLLQYLDGVVDVPKILEANGYDRIVAGGISRFSSELIGSRRFQNLLDSLLKQYDWIIAVTSAIPQSSEAESLIGHFQTAFISVNEETLNQLKSYIHHHPHKKIAFVIQE